VATWLDGERADGFSAAATPFRPARADGPYGYRTVNVAAQRHDPGSLYSWVAHAIGVRRQCPELGWGEWRTLKVSDPRVLAIETRWRDGLGDRPGQGEIRQLLSDTSSPAASEAGTQVRVGADITLGGYGFRWLRLTDDSALG
jgi:maltose alpha-D-glucosyltransferase/alpha-amylase